MAGDVLGAAEVADELDGDRVARLERGKLLGAESVVDGHGCTPLSVDARGEVAASFKVRAA